MKLQLINVGNGTTIYPGNFTREEITIIQKNLKSLTLHLFSGKSEIGDIRVDYTYGTHKQDVFEFLKTYQGNPNTILLDPPYNQKFADKYQELGNTPKQFIIFADTEKTTLLFNLINALDSEIIILKSWNYYCLKRYTIDQCYICYPGGYRKSTFLIIMKRKQETMGGFL